MPEPSRLVLLEQLSDLEPGAKVRFLGCVHAYDGKNATLLLRTRYPAHTIDSPRAIVNIEAVLETVNHELLQVGAWLNIMGNIRRGRATRHSKTSERMRSKDYSKPPLIDATMVWSAGAIQLEKHDAAVLDYQKALSPG